MRRTLVTMPHTPSTRPIRPLRPMRPMRIWQRAVLWALVAVVLAAVFMLYTQPDFMVRMADHVWACF